MKTAFETSKRVVTIIVKAQKCENEVAIIPILIYAKHDRKSLAFGWLKGYVEIEWMSKKK